MNEKSIFIGMPCLGGVNPQVVDSVFANMTGYVSDTHEKGNDINNIVEIRTIIGSLVYDARNTLAKSFLEESDKTHLFFWDSDVILYPNTLKILIEFDKDVVSIVYYSKEPPHQPVVGFDRVVINENKIGTHRPTNNAYLEDNLKTVWGVGLGGCLIKRSVIEKMLDNYDNPFYPFKGLGEDYSFCERLSEQGYEVNIAPKIRTFHIGSKTFQVDDYERQLKMYLSKQINERAQKMRDEQEDKND